MKYLFIPSNNSLSHIAKCLAIMDHIKLRGHQVEIAISKQHSAFLNNLGIKYHLLPDIQEMDRGGFPSFKWFSNVETIEKCITEEVALINEIKPDRVIGVFRFTLYASSQITKVPFDSLICGCMIPDSDEVLGYNGNEAGIGLQKKYLDNFFGFAGIKASRAMTKFGLAKIEDIRITLKGEQTFLWDFPEFMPIPKQTDLIHVGPICLEHWPYDPYNLDNVINSKHPIAVVSFGTCITNCDIVNRLVKILLDMDFKVIVAAGGQREMYNIKQSDSRVIFLMYAPLNIILPYASLLVTHGGQMTIFEALKTMTPVLVMPLQPEQAHNGVCLERIGCGSRLIPSTLFTGLPEDYINICKQMTDEDIKTKIDTLINNEETMKNLAKIRAVIDRYQGAKALVNHLLR